MASRPLQKFANQPLLFLVLDSSEQLGSQSRDGLRLVERHLVVNLTALKMAWLAPGLENGFDLSLKVGLCAFGCRERRGGDRRVTAGCLQSGQTP